MMPLRSSSAALRSASCSNSRAWASAFAACCGVGACNAAQFVQPVFVFADHEQDAEAPFAVGDRDREHLAAAERVEDQPAERVGARDRDHVAVFGGALHERDAGGRQPLFVDVDLRLAAARDERRRARSRQREAGFGRVEQVQRFVRDRAQHEFGRERCAHAFDRGRDLGFTPGAQLLRRRAAGALRVLVDGRAQISDENDGERGEDAVADADGIPVTSGVPDR